MTTTTKNVLRWIAVLPAAIVCYCGTSLVLAIGNEIIKFLYEDEAWTRNGLSLIQSIVAPAACVWYGSRVAPSYRFVTAVSLSAIHFITVVAAIILLIVTKHWNNWEFVWLVFLMLVCVTSTIVACVAVGQDEAENPQIESNVEIQSAV